MGQMASWKPLRTSYEINYKAIKPRPYNYRDRLKIKKKPLEMTKTCKKSLTHATSKALLAAYQALDPYIQSCGSRELADIV